MNPMIMDLFVSHPLNSALGWTLVHFIWQAAIIGLLLGRVLKVVPQSMAPLRYVISCVGLAVISLIPIGTLIYCSTTSQPTMSQAQPVENSSELTGLSPNSPVPTTEEIYSESRTTPSLYLGAAGTQRGTEMRSSSTDDRRADWTSSITGTVRSLQPVLPWCVSLWMMGVAILSLRFVVGLRRVWLWRRSSTRVVTGELIGVLEALTRRMQIRSPVLLMQSVKTNAPAVIGWFRPAILVPASMISGLTTKELELILAHELAHIRRHDYLVNLFQTIAETVLFYHPVVWWLSDRIRIEREHCCDDVAVTVMGNRVGFVQALAKMEEFRCAEGRLAMSANGGHLVSRIRRLVTQHPVRGASSWLGESLVLGLLGSLLCGLWITVALASPVDPTVPSTESTEAVVHREDGTEPLTQIPEVYSTRKSEVTKTDSRTGIEKRVFPGIKIWARVDGTRNEASLDMMYSNVMMYSFIPTRVAKQLNAVELGTIDFGSKAPSSPNPLQASQKLAMNLARLGYIPLTEAQRVERESRTVHSLTGLAGDARLLPYPDDSVWIPGHLGFYGMNKTKQHVFKVARLERVDLGVGPSFGPINVLLLDDENSEFGVIGRDWAQQPRGTQGESLWFAADGTFHLMNGPKSKASTKSQDKEQNPDGQSGVRVQSNRDVPIDPRLARPKIKVMKSHTYDLNSRQSTDWIEWKGVKLPVDIGVEHGGVKVYMTLMYDVIAVDVITNEVLWGLAWAKKSPIWQSFSIVELPQGDGKTLALELFAADRKTKELTYRYLNLGNGELVKIPVEESDSDLNLNHANSTQKEDESRKLPRIRVVERDGGEATRAIAKSQGTGRSPKEMLRHFSTISARANVRLTGSVTNMETLVSAHPRYLLANALDADEVLFNLPEGAGMRAEFSGKRVEIHTRGSSVQVVVTGGSVELLDAGGVVRAKASPDGGAEQLVVTCTIENDEVVLAMKTNRLVKDDSYPNPPVQVKMNIDTGAPEDEEDPPHGAVRYSILPEDKADGKPARMKMQWHYNLKRLADEAREQDGAATVNIPSDLSQRKERTPEQVVMTDDQLLKTAVALGDWTTNASLRFDSRRAMKLADGLRRLPEARRVKVLKEMGRQQLEGQLIVMCRMLFEAKNSQTGFRRPFIGAPLFVGTNRKIADYPLEPITFIKGVPLLIVKGYSLGGQAEPARAYLDYCLKECQWTKRPFVLNDDIVSEVLTSIHKAPFWGDKLDSDEWPDVVRLKNQLYPNVLLRVSAQPWISKEQPLFLLEQSHRVSPTSIQSEMKKLRFSTGTVINVMVDNNAKQPWLESIVASLEEAGFKRIELIKWQVNSQPVEVSQLKKLFETKPPTNSAPGVARKLPWAATGIVTDKDGKPLKGVEVRAHCGVGTLRRSGTATTGVDGKYELRFGPGYLSRGGTSLQAATISVYLEGHFEKNLHRQGDMVAALKKPEGEIGWGGKTEEDLFLPNQPKQIDFVMVPAVTIKGLILGPEGLRGGVRVSLTGTELPPSSSVIEQVRTNEKGEYEFKDVPTGYRFQFLIEPAKAEPPWLAWASAPVTFVTGETNDIHLEYKLEGKNIDLSCQRFDLIVDGKGVNWKKALKEAEKQKLDVKWDGLSTDTIIRASRAWIELGKNSK